MTRLLFPILLAFTVCAFAHPGVGIVMDSKGNVFFTDLKNVLKIDKAGKVSIAVSKVHTHELYLDENDNLYGEHLWYEGEATDKWGHYVWKLSPAGQLEKVIPNTEGFLDNYSFVHDNKGHMLFAERADKCQHVVQLGRPNMPLTKQCFNDIRWMTFSRQGNIYLVDHHDVKKIGASGTVETLATNIAERKLTQFTVNDQHLAMGIWTDQNENAYVAVYGARKVKKISKDKKITDVIETSMMWSPTGGLTAANGDFWLLECSPTNDVRVEKITPDGKRTVFAER
jgi:hypothetical protein